MKKLMIILLLCSIALIGQGQTAKYVFYFIGDGMGPNHVLLGGGDSLNFAQFPFKGTLTTHSTSAKITDSAAAGTALATGQKTSNGTIAMTADHSSPLRSIAYDAQKMGKKVGIITTVSIDHATPASFYASVEERKMAYQIASQLPTTGFDLFAGSGFVKAQELFSVFKDSLYTIVRGRHAQLNADKIIWIQDEQKNVGNLPFALERKSDDLELPIFTQRAIEFLSKDTSRGFFMMVEGGLIDWAAHSNKADLVRGEVRDFASAIAHAIDFYKAHPNETLIVVTADHETGGLSLDPTAWSSLNHTSTPVPIYAIGVGAERFAGEKDNTAVAPLIKAAL